MMRYLLLSLFLLTGTLVANTNWFLKFDYTDTVPSNAIVRVYYSTNITTPLTNWSVVATNTLVYGTNSTREKLPFSRITPNFFVVSVSNEWGEVFSDVLGSWPLSGNGIKLRLSAE